MSYKFFHVSIHRSIVWILHYSLWLLHSISHSVNTHTHTIFYLSNSGHLSSFPLIFQFSLIRKDFFVWSLYNCISASQGWNQISERAGSLLLKILIDTAPLSTVYESACFLHSQQYLILSVPENIRYNQNYKFVPVWVSLITS